MAAPCDLHVSYINGQEFPEEYITQAVKLGYRTLAVNQDFRIDTEGHIKGKKKSKDRVVIKKVDQPDNLLEKLSRITGGNDVKILSRLTIEYGANSNDTLRSLAPSMAQFDIIALKPQDQKALDNIKNLDGYSIVCLDTSQKSLYRISKENLNSIRMKNMVIELVYGSSVLGTTARQNTIQLAQDVLVFSKGRNMILSSGSQMTRCLRAPYDVVNFGVLFGLDTKKAKDTVFETPLDAVRHAAMRNTMKSILVAKKPEIIIEYTPVSKSDMEFHKNHGILGESDQPLQPLRKKPRKK